MLPLPESICNMYPKTQLLTGVNIFTASSKRMRASLIAQLVKNLPAMQESLVGFLAWEDLLEKG